MTDNKTLMYKKIPQGVPVPGEHLVIESKPIDLDNAPSNGLTVEIHQASVDPYLRGRMREPSTKSYFPAFELNTPVVNTIVAKVLKSNHADYKEGDLIIGFAPIAEYARIEDLEKSRVRKLDNPHGLDTSLFLGPLGMPGLTAYSALHKIGKPQKGETIFVSSAAGAVGQMVGQIAKREGLTVIGSVGSDEKLEFITKELGFDSGFNYKKESVFDAVPRLAPDGLDIYWENVGGEHLEAAVQNMKKNGRIPVCGMIDGYNTPKDQQKGIKGLTMLVANCVAMEGFLVGKPEFGPAYFKEHQEKVGQWLNDGSIKSKLHFTDGIEHAADAFVGMLEGKNFGKAIVRIK